MTTPTPAEWDAAVSALYPQEVVDEALRVVTATAINLAVLAAIKQCGGYGYPAVRPLLKAIQK